MTMSMPTAPEVDRSQDSHATTEAGPSQVWMDVPVFAWFAGPMDPPWWSAVSSPARFGAQTRHVRQWPKGGVSGWRPCISGPSAFIDKGGG